MKEIKFIGWALEASAGFLIGFKFVTTLAIEFLLILLYPLEPHLLLILGAISTSVYRMAGAMILLYHVDLKKHNKVPLVLNLFVNCLRALFKNIFL